jgi:hypothetical protein
MAVAEKAVVRHHRRAQAPPLGGRVAVAVDDHRGARCRQRARQPPHHRQAHGGGVIARIGEPAAIARGWPQRSERELDRLAGERCERDPHAETAAVVAALERKAALDGLARPRPRRRREPRVAHVIDLRLIAPRDDGAHARRSGPEADHRLHGLVYRVVRQIGNDVQVVAREQDLERLHHPRWKNQTHTASYPRRACRRSSAGIATLSVTTAAANVLA